MNLIPPFKKLFCDKSHREDGFTLIEVLVSLTIFAIGLLALAGMQVTGIQGNSRAQSVSAKVALADGVIEEFLAMAGADPRLDPVSPPVTYDWPGATGIDIDGAGTCTATVTVMPNPTIGTVTYNDLTQIEVTVANQVGADVEKTVMKRRY